MTERDAVLDNLVAVYPELSPQLRQAAKYVIDAPAEVAINSMRRIAGAAGVGPSTMLRLTKKLGFVNYEEFRKPFQEAMRTSGGSFADRAEWLRSLGGSGRQGLVFSGMAESAISNIESAFEMVDPNLLRLAAERIRKARKVFIIGGGTLRSVAEYFYGVCRLVFPECRLVGYVSGYPLDDLADGNEKDVLVAISIDPYADFTVRGVEFARKQGLEIIAITDSRASPIARETEILIVAPTTSPLFFPSQVAAVALLETLVALIVRGSDARTIKRINEIENLRIREGYYWQRRE